MPAIPRHVPGYSFGTGRTQDYYTIKKFGLKVRADIFSSVSHLNEVWAEIFLRLRT